MRAPPGSTVSEYGVEDHEQLPHARHQSHLLGLADLNESFVELLHGGVESRGDQGSHAEYLPKTFALPPHTVRLPLKVPEESQFRACLVTDRVRLIKKRG
jgi:hypothetical protein